MHFDARKLCVCAKIFHFKQFDSDPNNSPREIRAEAQKFSQNANPHKYNDNVDSRIARSENSLTLGEMSLCEVK